MTNVLPLHPAAYATVIQAEQALAHVENSVDDLLALAPADVAGVLLRAENGIIPARTRLSEMIGRLIALRNEIVGDVRR